MISAIFLLVMVNTTFLNGQIGTTRPTTFTWEGALDGNKAIWKVNDTLNVYQNLEGVDVSVKLLDPLKINTNAQNPSEYNDYTKTNTFYNKGNLAFQITSTQKTQTACLEFNFSKPIYLNDFQVWDIDMLQSSTTLLKTYQDSVTFFAKTKAGNVPLTLTAIEENPVYTISRQSAKANFVAGVNGDIAHNNPSGAVAISSLEPVEILTLCHSNGSQDDGLSNSHAIKITSFTFTELIGGLSGTIYNEETGLPLAGSIVKLVDKNGNIVENKDGWAMQIMTDETGQYNFQHLPMGIYTVVQINPLGYDSYGDIDGVNDNNIIVELDVTKPYSFNNDFFEIQQGPLPVKIESFTVSQSEKGKIEADWNVSIEQNCSHYEVQLLNKSNQIIQSEIHKFEAENKGFYQSKMTYEGQENKLYVKLLQYDLDGTMTDLGTRVISFNNKKVELTFYPNPTKSILYVNNTSDQEIIKTVILDLNGKELWNTDSPTLSIDLTQFSNGVYFVQCVTANEIITKKILKD